MFGLSRKFEEFKAELKKENNDLKEEIFKLKYPCPKIGSVLFSDRVGKGILIGAEIIDKGYPIRFRDDDGSCLESQFCYNFKMLMNNNTIEEGEALKVRLYNPKIHKIKKK